MPVQPDKNTSSNDLGALVSLKESVSDTIDFWAEAYFRLEVTTSPRSRVEQKRDLQLFLDFMGREEGQLDRRLWTPRLSRAFADYLQGLKKENGQRRFGDRTINRVLAHMKTFAKWIHKLRPFPLGNPMEKIKALVTGSTLEIEKALTPSERRRLLDSADRLLVVGGRSRNRRLARKDFEKRPRRKGYRPYRNRAVIYTLIETGMRRAAVCNIDLDDVDFQKRMLPAQEKEGMDAIRDYLDHEREQDNGR